MPPKDDDMVLYRSDTTDDDDDDDDEGWDDDDDDDDDVAPVEFAAAARRKKVMRTGRPMAARNGWKDLKSAMSLPSSSVITSPGCTPGRYSGSMYDEQPPQLNLGTLLNLHTWPRKSIRRIER